MQVNWQTYPDSAALAEALASTVAAKLGEAIATRGSAFIAVSGGSTPKKFFAALSRKPLDWAKVTVTLVDERFVDEASDRSNASLVRNNLLQNEAAAARFIGLYHNARDANSAAHQASEDLVVQNWPLDVAILGMGTDGHTASFFPDAPNLATLLDPARPTLVEAVDTVAGGEPRLTLPLARLIDAGFVALHIEGEEKRSVLDAAMQPGSELPVSAVLRHAREPLPVYWAG
ncbi:6-phosphogluconolactonase [Aminobacter sp. J44]|uniref:6-phosphogluconolactonase n=1 Tax=Aminobacter sp. J44 TaxID=935262 RepID=UPI00119BCFA2|nr:6-phosphogluconolactonase [Aminobacter sp. J44]TWG61708.1 6-phosphogluconolactonase [Aminobacter sp. J44]